MQVSVIQMSPGSDKPANIAQAQALIDRCVQADRPDLIILPEVWTCLGGTNTQKFHAAEHVPPIGSDHGGGEAILALREMARRYQVFIHSGSLAEQASDRLFNTSVVISPAGTLVARYSKMHLFDITTPNGLGYRESDTYRAGNDVVTVPIEGRFGRACLGLAICYDLRFGELFRRLREQGADVIVLPAAFTSETGTAHWETLVRARAIETQCWVAAAGTVGAHEDANGHPRHTFGHSMVVDPWGAVVAQASSGPGFATARVDPALTDRIRASIPVMDHRRLQ